MPKDETVKILDPVLSVDQLRLFYGDAEALSRITFERWSSGRETGKTILCNSGFEAVEAALKTAHLRTGMSRMSGVI